MPLEDSIKRRQVKSKISRKLSLVFRMDEEYYSDMISTKDNLFSREEFDLFCFLLEHIDPDSIIKNAKTKNKNTSPSPDLLIQVRRYNKWQLFPVTQRKQLLLLIKALCDKNNTICRYIPPIFDSSPSELFNHLQDAILLPQFHNIKNNLSQIRKYFSANGSIYPKATDYDIVINTFNNQELIRFDKEFSELVQKYNIYNHKSLSSR